MKLYIFDCLNADVSGRYFTKEQLPNESEAEAIDLAANYEATLYRLTVDDKTRDIKKTEILYQPAFF